MVRTIGEHMAFLKNMDAMDKAIGEAVKGIKDGHDADEFLSYLIASLSKEDVPHAVVTIVALKLEDLLEDLRDGKS